MLAFAVEWLVSIQQKPDCQLMIDIPSGLCDRITVTYLDEKDKSEKTIQVPIGQSLMDAAHANDIDLEGMPCLKCSMYNLSHASMNSARGPSARYTQQCLS
jgi:hypothetical protein